MTRRHRPVPAVRKTSADVRRTSPSIRQVDAAVQSKPIVAPADRVRTTYIAPVDAGTTGGEPIPLGSKNTELRSKIARLSGEHERLRIACTRLLVAIARGQTDEGIRTAAKAVAEIVGDTKTEAS